MRTADSINLIDRTMAHIAALEARASRLEALLREARAYVNDAAYDQWLSAQAHITLYRIDAALTEGKKP